MNIQLTSTQCDDLICIYITINKYTLTTAFDLKSCHSPEALKKSLLDTINSLMDTHYMESK